jgi:ERCC4-type nuclease
MTNLQSHPTIIIDTREKIPYEFQSSPSIRGKLDAGDYSISGHEGKIAVERKSLSDFVNTIIHCKDRFRGELKLLAAMDRSCIVVEGDLSSVVDGTFAGNASPSSIFGIAISIIIDMNVPIFFCSDRAAAREFVERYLGRWWRNEMMREKVVGEGVVDGSETKEAV